MHEFKVSRRTVLAGMGASLATPMLGGVAGAQGNPTEITYWGFAGGTHISERAVALFQEKNPNIKVNYVATSGHYMKLRNALAAGTGIPDAADMEYHLRPSFNLANALADISTLGSADLSGDYPEWAWDQVKVGDAIYAMPRDAGPMVVYYREDILSAASIAVPQTWDEVAAACRTLKATHPNVNFTQFVNNSPSWLAGLFRQKGWHPFTVDGTNIAIDINGQPAKDVLAYWQGLVDEKVVDTGGVSNPEWFAKIDNGETAMFIGAAWNLVSMIANANKGMGKWRIAPLPNWDANNPVPTISGGLSSAVLATSEKKEAAYEFAKFLSHDIDAAKIALDAGLFPVLNAARNDKALMGEPVPFLGGQSSREVYNATVESIKPGFQWSPFQDYVQEQLNDNFGKAASGELTLEAAIDNVQTTVVNYASDQGFTVTN